MSISVYAGTHRLYITVSVLMLWHTEHGLGYFALGVRDVLLLFNEMEVPVNRSKYAKRCSQYFITCTPSLCCEPGIGTLELSARGTQAALSGFWFDNGTGRTRLHVNVSGTYCTLC